MMSGLPIDSAYVGLGGVQVRGINSRGVIAISRRNRDITEEDVYRVIDQARAVSVPTDREIIDVLPQEFTVDGQDGIGNPIGFLGMRLEASVHVVTSPITARQNVITSVNRPALWYGHGPSTSRGRVHLTRRKRIRRQGPRHRADITNLTVFMRRVRSRLSFRWVQPFHETTLRFYCGLRFGRRTHKAKRRLCACGIRRRASGADVRPSSEAGSRECSASTCADTSPEPIDLSHAAEEVQRAGLRQILSSVV